MPVLVNAQVDVERSPEVPRGPIDLVVCCGCGHMYNRSFDARVLEYDANYENTLHFSAQFQEFARELAERLVRDHHLRGATVGELGSGPGHFLTMLCDAGVARARGWDPSYDPDRLGAPTHAAVEITTEPFPSDGSVAVQLAFSQHVLEHLADPVVALAALRAAAENGSGAVYSEVPNGTTMVHHTALWDLIYEHLSYFVPISLDVACRRAGLRTTASGSAFGGQFLWSEASPGPFDPDALPAPGDVEAAVAAARGFGVASERRIDMARTELAELAARGPVALWGAGSKGVTYLNLMSEVAAVDAVIDINPRKAGWGVPGTSLVVDGPERLRAVQPRTVLAANPIYVDEISALLESIGVEAEVLSLWR
jgi:hypothetical protein